MKTTTCIKCNTKIRNCNFKKHAARCDGSGVLVHVNLTNCPHCDLDLNTVLSNAGHVKWCKNNPRLAEYVAANNCKQMQTNLAVSKRQTGLVRAHADGKYKESYLARKGRPGKPHTVETKELIRQKALASPHRRLVRSIRPYTQKDGTIVQLDSMWEEALAKRLDEIDVDWVRPTAIKYTDSNNVSRNYFPDFYLPDYDIFLDPKNPYAIKAQQEKINCLTIQLKNLIIITSLEECNTFTPSQTMRV